MLAAASPPNGAALNRPTHPMASIATLLLLFNMSAQPQGHEADWITDRALLSFAGAPA